MTEKFEVSFNSPQCGFMSVGFSDAKGEFHSTTACTPHADALTEILTGLTSLISAELPRSSFVVAWSRNPEVFDLYFTRNDDQVDFKVVEFPTSLRDDSGVAVFSHEGSLRDFCNSFISTFNQLYDDRDTDEFEANWKQPFPFAAFAELKRASAAVFAG